MSHSDFVTRGQALVSSGQYQEAVKVCRLGLLGRPTTVEGRIVLGQALIALKRYDEVLAEMRVTLELDHNSQAAQALKGEALLRKGDGPGALEVLTTLRSLGVADAHVMALLGEAERLVGRSPAGHPGHAAGPVSPVSAEPPFASEPPTRHYPAQVDVTGGAGSRDDTGSQYTRPTTLAAPSAKKRATPGPEMAPTDATPPPAVLAVGDRSGTLEVDPERDALDERGDDDFGDVVGPPSFDGPDPDAVTAERKTARGAGPVPRAPRSSAAPPVAAARAQRAELFKEEASTVELDDEVVELGGAPTSRRSRRKVPGPGTAVRNAVKMPSGPIDQSSAQAAGRSPQPPAHLAQLIANQPHVMNVAAPPAPASPRGPIAAALPTAAALPMGPGMQPVPMPPAMPLQPPPSMPGLQRMPAPSIQPSATLPPPAQARPAPSPAAQPLQVPRSLPLQPPQAPTMQAMQVPSSLPMQSPAMQAPAMQPPAMQPLAMQAPRMQPAMQPPRMQPAMQPPRMQPAMQPPMMHPPVMSSPGAPSPPPLGQPALPFSQPPQAAIHQFPPHLQSNLAAARPTIALSPAQQAGASAQTLYNGQDAQPAWARATMIPGGPAPGPYAGRADDDPSREPGEIDPQIAALLAGPGPDELAAAYSTEASSDSRSHRTATPRGRSRLQILMWVMIGAAVIGGGVFAGFQIRGMRLRKQIAVARDQAVDLARADTWSGWIGARDSLYSIAQASPTDENKAALARVRALIAYEFGDGVADARAAIEQLGGRSSVELDLATAYVALAQSDLKAARDAAERAQQTAPEDPAALYLSGQTALLAGDIRSAVADLRRAYERDARPLYAVGLARALAASSAWDEALATLDRAGDNPAAVTAKGVVLVAAGRILAGQGAEIRAQLGKIIADGKQGTTQARKVSPTQVAFADLALARVEFARNDAAAARAALRAALELNVDDQRFAEEVSDTLYAIGDLETAHKAASRTLKLWPASRRARVTLAQIWLAFGKPAAALEELGKASDLTGSPRAQTVRGEARLAAGDVEGARADFDAALKKLPGFEPALIARTGLDLAAGELDEARQRVEARFNPKTASPGMTAVYAAVLRATGDPASRDKAKALLERVAGGAASPDVVRAQLELARIDRDLGDVRGARAAYADASRSGNFEARLENALFQIDEGEPRAGRDLLEQLLKEAGDQPAANLLLEAARARTLIGDHAGALDLLARAEKAPAVTRWQLDRERGRIALRKSDTAFAAQALVRALDGCGADLDTFLLAADTLSADDKQPALRHKLKALADTRLKGRPELRIIAGKQHFSAERYDEAHREFTAAHDALVAEKASSRRVAQASYGLAAIAYEREDDPRATNLFNLVLVKDPSIYSAYLYAAEIEKVKQPRKALEHAQQAAAFNPDSLDAWRQVGTIAAQLDKTKVLDEAIARVRELAPGSEVLRQLQSLR